MKHAIDLAAQRESVQGNLGALGATRRKRCHHHQTGMRQNRRFQHFKPRKHRQGPLRLTLLKVEGAQQGQGITLNVRQYIQSGQPCRSRL